MPPGNPPDNTSTARYVIAELAFSKGDLFGVKAIREFATLAGARAAYRENHFNKKYGGAWPDWKTCEILETIGGEYRWKDEYGLYSVKSAPVDDPA